MVEKGKVIQVLHFIEKTQSMDIYQRLVTLYVLPLKMCRQVVILEFRLPCIVTLRIFDLGSKAV